MEQIANHLANLLGSQGIIKEDDVDICRYGLEIFSIIILSLFIGNCLETVVFFTAFVPLRIYAGGYHADTRLRCYGILLVVYAIFSVLLITLPPTIYAVMISAEVLFPLAIVFLFAPVSHNNKHLGKTEIRTYKNISRSIVLIQAVIVLSGLFIFKSNVYLLAFTIGQLSVILSMIAAMIKKRWKGGAKI